MAIAWISFFEKITDIWKKKLTKIYKLKFYSSVESCLRIPKKNKKIIMKKNLIVHSRMLNTNHRYPYRQMSAFSALSKPPTIEIGTSSAFLKRKKRRQHFFSYAFIWAEEKEKRCRKKRQEFMFIYCTVDVDLFKYKGQVSLDLPFYLFRQSGRCFDFTLSLLGFVLCIFIFSSYAVWLMIRSFARRTYNCAFTVDFLFPSSVKTRQYLVISIEKKIIEKYLCDEVTCI